MPRRVAQICMERKKTIRPPAAYHSPVWVLQEHHLNGVEGREIREVKRAPKRVHQARVKCLHRERESLPRNPAAKNCRMQRAFFGESPRTAFGDWTQRRGWVIGGATRKRQVATR